MKKWNFLTNQQKELARYLVGEVRAGNLPESFHALEIHQDQLHFPELKVPAEPAKPGERFRRVFPKPNFAGLIGAFDVLSEGQMLVVKLRDATTRYCTLTGLIYAAVDSNFEDEEPTPPISSLARPHPPEIAMSLDRLRRKYPDPNKLGFLIMRFAASKPLSNRRTGGGTARLARQGWRTAGDGRGLAA